MMPQQKQPAEGPHPLNQSFLGSSGQNHLYVGLAQDHPQTFLIYLMPHLPEQ